MSDMGRLEMLAKEMMSEHGLLDDGWKFAWMSATSMFGICDSRHKEIRISREFTAANPDVEFVDTVLHEIAHALVGFRAGHGWRWREACLRIGARPDRLIGDETVAPPVRYAGRCMVCNEIVSRRQELGAQFLARQNACGRHGGWSPETVIVWEDTRKA